MHFGYGHAEHARVREGDTVKAGQRIGRAGFANAPHVHFMVNGGNTTRGVGDRDPMPFVRYAIKHE
jgi:murein DD-endopeptidase MepM/ murein hydrolase activator NlpD